MQYQFGYAISRGPRKFFLRGQYVKNVLSFENLKGIIIIIIFFLESRWEGALYATSKKGGQSTWMKGIWVECVEWVGEHLPEAKKKKKED